MDTSAPATQRQAVALVIVINIVVPFVLLPLKVVWLPHSPGIFWLYVETLNIVLPLLSVLFLWKYFAIPPSSYGLTFPPRLSWDVIGQSLLVAVTIGVAYFFVLRVLWSLLWEQVEIPSVIGYHATLPSGLWRVPAIAGMSLTAGLFESIVFIGLPWLLFKHRANSTAFRWAFVCCSSLAFGASHRGNGTLEVIATAVFGLVAALWFVRLRDLWPIVLGHAAVDVRIYWSHS
jgi:hypothetical protein